MAGLRVFEDLLRLVDPTAQGYALSIAPLAILMTAVPTLDEAARGELLWPRAVIVEPRELHGAHRRWGITEASLREGRWWTLVTYMFLHSDADHLLNNLASILVSGRGVYGSVGAAGLYTVFLAAGAAAGANRRGRLQQVEAQIAGEAKAVPEFLSSWGMPSKVCDLVDAGIRGAAKSTAPVFNNMSVDLGASGGASGLMGFCCGLTLERLIRVVDEWRRYRNDATFWNSSNDIVALLVTLDSCRMLTQDWHKARGRDGVTGVDHSGHLTGFVTGLGLLVALRAASWVGSAAVRRWGARFFPLLTGGGNDVDDEGGGVRGSRGRRGRGRRYIDAEGNVH
eukprot:TRINITY_DN68050_c0_g1_i1.p1 TRINITY_DN68050_c0_g1~~TRINITY_DN68050_c0_g1_i1.p1  ORF type:complete len:361 (-),score=47.54 TRINITY_DN68050_c0_g1_i1:9-1025(-)